MAVKPESHGTKFKIVLKWTTSEHLVFPQRDEKSLGGHQ